MRALGQHAPSASVLVLLVFAGAGEWADASRATCKIFSKSPAEWAVQLHKWATENGLSVPGSLYTVFELHSGDISYGSAFAGMDPFILMKALEHLEKNGLVSGRGRRECDRSERGSRRRILTPVCLPSFHLLSSACRLS